MKRVSFADKERRSRKRLKREPLKRAGSWKAEKPNSGGMGFALAIFAIIAGAGVVYLALDMHARYTVSVQAPVRLRLQWPLAIARRIDSEAARQAQLDQRRPLSAFQQYACEKFAQDCRVALAIQRAENPEGKCETYHYNPDGTLDWGYFQINTVHLRRPGLNLRDLLDCKANIDFAFELYGEQQGFKAWSSYRSGLYRRFMGR